MDRPKKDRPKLYIANLQWTPKDAAATLKINGRCDEIMKRVMVSSYNRRLKSNQNEYYVAITS